MRRGGAATGGPSSANLGGGGDSNRSTTKMGISIASSTSGVSAAVSCKSDVQRTTQTFEIWSGATAGAASQLSHGVAMSALFAMKHPASATLTCANASSVKTTKEILRLSRADIGDDCT